MLDPHGLYEIDTEVEGASGLDAVTNGTGPVLVNALRDWSTPGAPALWPSSTCWRANARRAS